MERLLGIRKGSHLPPNVPYPPIESPSTRLDAGKIYSFAKRFQDYELDGHGLEQARTPYGSAYNNMPILEMKTKMQRTMHKPRNSLAVKTLEPLSIETIPLEPLDNKLSPIKVNGGVHKGQLRAGFSGTYQKDHKYKMIFTQGHVERTEKQSHIIQEPFKKNLFHFEPYKKDFELKKYVRNQNRTLQMKIDSEQYKVKKDLITFY